MSKMILIDEGTVKLALEALVQWETGCGTTEYLAKVENVVPFIREALASAAKEQSAKDEFKAAYIEAMVASNEAGFAGMSAAETIRELSRMVAEQPAQPQQEPVTAITRYELLRMAQAAGLEEEFLVDPLSEQRFRLFAQLAASALAPQQPTAQQQEPVVKLGMYEHKCPNVTGHRGPSFVCQKAGHGVGQNSYCKNCTCPETLNTSPQPAQQEPVAWMWKDGTITSDPDRADGTWMPLYTTPQAQPAQRTWVGLTDEERNAIGRHHAYVDNIIRATEAKLREKNA